MQAEIDSLRLMNPRFRPYILLRDRIAVLVGKDIKLKYNSTALGFAWSVLTPCCQSLIYYFVFKVVLRFTTDHYLLYLLSGTFLWQFFSNVVLMSGNVFLQNAGLLKKTAFPRSLLIFGTLCTESIHLLMTLLILAPLMYCSGVVPAWSALVNLPLLLLALGLFASGLALTYASVNTYFRDTERIANLFFQSWMMLSPVFIPMEAVPARYLALYRCNPMTPVLEVWRNIFYTPRLDPVPLALALVAGGGAFAAGWAIYRKCEPRLAEMM